MARGGFGMKVEGIDEFEAALEDLGRRLGRSTLERALRKAAKPMLQKAKDFSPSDQGTLVESLSMARVAGSDPGKAAFHQAMRQSGDRATAVRAMRDAYRANGVSEITAVSLALGPDMNKGGQHAHLVEFGTGPRYHENGKFVGAMPADPFLRPAFDAEARPTIDRLKPLLRAEIDKAVARRAARAAKKAGGV